MAFAKIKSIMTLAIDQRNHSRQQGVSLVEIMVSLVAGLILTAGVIQIFIANKQTYRVNNASARIQENARFALETLGRYLRIAGYKSNGQIDDETAFPAVPSANPIDLGFSAGQVLSGTDSEVRFRYQSDGDMTTCGGSSANLGDMVNTRLFLENGNLKCKAEVLDLSSSPPTQQSDNTQTLIDNVTNLTLLYGIDTDADNAANRYDKAANVGDWKQVVSLRLTLTLQSSENNTSISGNSLQKSYTTTIGLRNRLR